ncbi:hypothetical protein A8139_06950 [Marinomonas primoryensis]|uniref:Uncharacterized protein n=1 Tax=Marinomonas primoryensis TaxID=178399 RepID=A0A2Z4PQL6_9GAMM|nr:hypothetical protein [Marinomonas primoryensis]AWX99756.1 hypothetical protein A8139_06950 [Marinomonas primoryensis]
MKVRNIVQVIIFLVGVVLILTAMLFRAEASVEGEKNISVNIILLSIGCSVVAAVIINIFEHYLTLPEVNLLRFLSSWNLVNIFETRSDMNKVSNELMKKAKEIDISSLGNKSLINYQGDLLKNRLRDGMKIRFMVPDKDSEFIKQREIDENATAGEIKNNINYLIDWVRLTKNELNLKNDQIEIKMYTCLPIESIMRIDNHLFVGPFMVKKISQLTMAYQYKKGGNGYHYYKTYFNDIWKDENISQKIENN